MIVYSSTKKGFLSDVLDGYVEDKILTSFVKEVGHATGKREVDSWRKSLPYMSNVINDPVKHPFSATLSEDSWRGIRLVAC